MPARRSSSNVLPVGTAKLWMLSLVRLTAGATSLRDVMVPLQCWVGTALATATAGRKDRMACVGVVPHVAEVREAGEREERCVERRVGDETKRSPPCSRRRRPDLAQFSLKRVGWPPSQLQA